MFFHALSVFEGCLRASKGSGHFLTYCERKGYLMTETEKYLFDVHGYIVIKGALSGEEIAAANAGPWR